MTDRSNETLPPIVVVDDEDEALAIIRNLLRKARIENPVTEFKSGNDLIDCLESPPGLALADACLLLLDLRMPGMSGLEVLHWLRAHPLLQHAIVVMLSTYDHPEEISLAKSLGAHTYLLKYPSAEALGALVHLAERSEHAGKRR